MGLGPSIQVKVGQVQVKIQCKNNPPWEGLDLGLPEPGPLPSLPMEPNIIFLLLGFRGIMERLDNTKGFKANSQSVANLLNRPITGYFIRF